MNITKRCNNCKEIKPLKLFSLNPLRFDGHGSWCIECYDRIKETRLKNEEFPNRIPTTKYCWKCKQTKEVKLFCRDKSKKDGFCRQCKDCRNEYTRERRLNKTPPDIVLIHEEQMRVPVEYKSISVSLKYFKANSENLAEVVKSLLLWYGISHNRETQSIYDSVTSDEIFNEKPEIVQARLRLMQHIELSGIQIEKENNLKG